MASYLTTKAPDTVWATGTARYDITPMFRGNRVSLLLIGMANDGPGNEIVGVKSERELDDKFGGFSYDQIEIQAWTSGHYLSGSVLGTGSVVWTYKYVNEELIDFYLEGLKVETTGGYVTFKPPGTAGSGMVIFKYRGSQDGANLVRGWREAALAGVSPIYLLRLAQSPASADLGNFRLEAVNPGLVYERTQYIPDTAGTGITFVLPPGLCQKQTVTYYVPRGGNLEELADEINRDTALHRNVVRAWALEPTTGYLAIKTSGCLTGATGSAVRIADVVKALRNTQLDLIRNICILGMDAGDFHNVVETEIVELAAEPPTLWVFRSRRKLDSETTGQYVTSLLASGTYQHSNYSTIVANEAKFLVGSPYEYWGSAAALYSGILTREPFSTSQKVAGVDEVSPIYSKAQLDDLEVSGYTAFYRSIGRDMVVRRGVTTSTLWSIGTIKALQEVYLRIYDAFNRYIGENYITIADVDGTLAGILYSIPYVDELEFDTSWDGETLGINIYLRVYGEIKGITAQIALHPKNIIG